MTSHLGVDWAGSSWVVVKTGTEVPITTEPAFLNVWHQHGKDDGVKSILVDIPIGLPESGVRTCDEEAMTLLGNRRSTVFSIPPRRVVQTEDYPTARDENDGSLGSQSWWLFPRIREVDVFLREHQEAREKVYESHPEICFCKLSCDNLASKNSDEGRRQRLEILDEHDPVLHETVNKLVRERADASEWHHRISKGKLDDVIDAAVLAMTGKMIGLGERAVSNEYPALPERDTPGVDPKLGIELEIVHPGNRRS